MGYDTRFSLRLRLFFFERKLIKFLVSAFFSSSKNVRVFNSNVYIYIYICIGWMSLLA